jgi:hypothetical protein
MTRKVIYSFGEEDERDAFVFEVDPLSYDMIVGNLMREGVDLDAALEKAIAMLSAVVRMNDEDLTQDVLSAQAVATATVWFLFNEAADEDDRIEGDVLLVEKDGELFVTELIDSGAPDTPGG